MKERFRIPSYVLALSLASSACSDAQAIRKPIDYSGRSDFPKGLWRYTSGPHDDPGKDEVRYAIDIAPSQAINCPLPPGKEPNVRFSAIRGGEIILTNQQTGMIRIKDKDGIIWEYLHIRPDQVLKPGTKISFGVQMGTLDCINTTGIHAHVGTYLQGKDGKLIKAPINNRKIGDWTVHSGETPYNGTLTQEGWEIRTADARVCIPETRKPEPCGRDEKGRIIRNDIPNPYVERVPPTRP